MTTITTDDIRKMSGRYVRRVLEGHLYRLTECPRIQFVDKSTETADYDHRLWFVDGHQMGLGPSGMAAAVGELVLPAVLTPTEDAWLCRIPYGWINAPNQFGAMALLDSLVDKGRIDMRRNVACKFRDMDRSMVPAVWFFEVRRRAA